MSYLDMFNKLNLMDNNDYIGNFLLYNSSLVISGVKPAVTITLSKNNKKLNSAWHEFGSSFINTINLKFIKLRETDNAIVLMIYDESLLREHLIEQNALEFLLNIGYPSNLCINDFVKTLKTRYDKYHCPHELGLFLGIPFNDVKDFMECTTKECLLCGYWKVYNNLNEAQITFNKYNEVKKYTLNNMLNGNSYVDIVLNIKKYFQTV